MRISTQLRKSILLSTVYVILLYLYLSNEFNKHMIGQILDSFWLTGISVLYIILLLQKTEIRLSESYFRIRKIEYSTKIYSTIGIAYFKRIIHKYPLPGATLKINLRGKSKSDILNLENQMREAEQVHVFGFILMVFITILFAVKRSNQFLYWFSIFNILMNLYPIFLQRYNRNRVRLILLKIKMRQSSI